MCLTCKGAFQHRRYFSTMFSKLQIRFHEIFTTNVPACVSPGLCSPFIVVWRCVTLRVPGKHSPFKTVFANFRHHKSWCSDGPCHVPDTVHAFDASYLIYASHQTESRYRGQPPRVRARSPRHQTFQSLPRISELGHAWQGEGPHLGVRGREEASS